MLALFIFKDGNTRQMEIPVANPQYYFHSMRTPPLSYYADDLGKEIRAECIRLNRVTPNLNEGFVMYEEL